MQAILDSPFTHPGSDPIWGGKKREFRDWTRLITVKKEKKWRGNKLSGSKAQLE